MHQACRKELNRLTKMKNTKKAHETAENRMSAIAPLLAPGLDRETVRQIRKDIVEHCGFSARTLDRYLSAYHQEGFSGLLPQGKGSVVKRKISQELLEEAIALRRELPSRSIPTIIQILEMEGKAEPGFLKRTTLQDALQREGFSSGMMKIYHDPTCGSQRFQRLHRNDLWQGDIKYGPILKIDGVPTQTYLSCLIDDATRMILYAAFYDNMTESIVEDTLHQAVVKYGAPKRLYFDNGSQYRTHWMARACTLLGTKLIYAKPRNPQGKGKQERFNETVDSFLAECALEEIRTLKDLNGKFNAWLSECYTKKIHSGIGTTPEIAFKSDSMPLRYIDQALLARIFLHCEIRKVDKSGCISFEGKKYDLGMKYIGRIVDVVYDPANTAILTIEVSGEAPFTVREIQVGEHVRPRPVRPEPQAKADHSRLLSAASKKYQANTVERRRAISYASEIGEGAEKGR
jgi:putative transposase